MTTVAYCYGLKAQDANPTGHKAPDFDGFVAQILALPRATTRDARTYICGPMRSNGDGRAHRGKADLLPRLWLALDLDGGTRDDAEIMLMRLANHQAVAWTTARHTPECPRIRALLALDRLVDGPEGERLGAAFVGVVGAGLNSLKWDRSTHHGEWECFLPMAGAKVMRYGGDPIDVDAVLALAPAEPSRERLATADPYRALIIERGLFLRELGPGRDAIICPFTAEHYEQTSDTATAYLWPLHNGQRWGKIHCLHQHCSARQQEDYIRALGADPRAVWRRQAGGAEPYDDLPPVEAYGEDARRHTARGGNSGAAHGNGAAPAGACDSENWPEPGQIQAALRPVPAFDPDGLLPESLRAWVKDEATRMPCPPDFVATAVLVQLGAIIGARCAIKPKAKDDWVIVPNLWGAAVGDPSQMKSPAIGVAIKPLDRLIARAREEYQEALGAFETANVIFEAKEESIKTRIKAAAKKGNNSDLNSLASELKAHRQQAPKKPTPRRYKTNDTTVEKLGELLRENPTGLLVLRDELVGLIASWDKEGREGDRAFFLEAWNGNASFETDRIKRGSIFITNLCLSIFGGIQPDRLTAYLEQAEHALANDGMLQRFQLLVYPDRCLWEWRDRFPAKDPRTAAFDVFDVLAGFDPVAWGASPADVFVKFPHFSFDEAAQEIFIQWSGDLHRGISVEEHAIIEQHLAKFAKLFPALALILHLVECAATGRRGPVSAEAARRAVAWCEYLEAHARRCYGLLIDDGLRSSQALASKVGQGKLQDSFTARDIRRNRWRYLTGDKAIQAALDWLEDEGWVLAKQVGGQGPGTGRRTFVYRINPKAVKSGKPGRHP